MSQRWFLMAAAAAFVGGCNQPSDIARAPSGSAAGKAPRLVGFSTLSATQFSNAIFENGDGSLTHCVYALAGDPYQGSGRLVLQGCSPLEVPAAPGAGSPS